MSAPPTLEQLRAFLRNHESGKPLTKREIVKAWNIKGEAARTALKDMLRTLKAEGLYCESRTQARLPGVMWLEVTAPDEDGRMSARIAAHKKGQQKFAAHAHLPIVIDESKRAAPRAGTIVLARLVFARDRYRALIIRVEPRAAAQALVGIIESAPSGRRQFRSCDKRLRLEFLLPQDTAEKTDITPGDLVRVSLSPSSGRQHQQPAVSELTRIGTLDEPHVLSRLTLAQHGITPEFLQNILDEADALAAFAGDDGTHDLTAYPFVTIDGEDAKDFDDAVYGEIKSDGTGLLWVAIADVSRYVAEGSGLDIEARRRGNSIYLPDMAVPMLPERLSNDLCSLREGEIRPVMAVRIPIGKNGTLGECQFFRAQIRSQARLTYQQAEPMLTLKKPQTPVEKNLEALFQIYQILRKKRKHRGAIDLERTEYQIIFADNYIADAVRPRLRLESHKLIEEMMIAANVAVAGFLASKQAGCVYRIHDRPPREAAEELCETVRRLGFTKIKKIGSQPKDYQHLLDMTRESPHYDLLAQAVLRSQSQALYAPDNRGHFGLALERYCHFTSPIRRYADLSVHRALGFWLEQTKPPRIDDSLCQHISTTERAAQKCEYDAFDRHAAQSVVPKIGDTAAGIVTYIGRFGLFVRLERECVEGFVPKEFLLPTHKTGRRIDAQNILARRFSLLQSLTVTIERVNPLTGEVTLRPVEINNPGKKQNRKKRSKK